MNVQESKYQELAGDPDHLHAMAQHYLSIADAIRKSVPALNAIHDEDQNQSQATDKLKGDAKDLADDITKAESRYRVTAEALLHYVPHLRAAQADAHTAVVNIAHYTNEVSTTSTALTKAKQAVDESDDTGKDDAQTAQKTAQTAAHDAQAGLSAWQDKWETAAGNRDAAAENAKSMIVNVVQHHNNGLKNPEHHWYDKFKKFVSSAWHVIKSAPGWVYDHLDEISSFLGVASLLLGWVPGLGQALLIATLVVGVLKIGKDIAEGKGWKAILGDSVSLALTALAGPAGKYLAKAGKFRSMEGAMGGTTNKAARMLSNETTAFKATYGVKPMQFAKFAQGKTSALKNIAKPGMSSFRSEVTAPFKFEAKNLGTEFKNYVKSGGGLNFSKLGQDVNWGEGANIFKTLPTLNKIGLLAVDGRKALTSVQTVINTGADIAHHNYSLNPHANPQITLQPDKALINSLPGGHK